jgi:hypothetical protein
MLTVSLQETLLGENQVCKEIFAVAVVGEGELQSSLQGFSVAVRTKMETLDEEVKKATDFRRLEEQFMAELALSESPGRQY